MTKLIKSAIFIAAYIGVLYLVGVGEALKGLQNFIDSQNPGIYILNPAVAIPYLFMMAFVSMGAACMMMMALLPGYFLYYKLDHHKPLLQDGTGKIIDKWQKFPESVEVEHKPGEKPVPKPLEPTKSALFIELPLKNGKKKTFEHKVSAKEYDEQKKGHQVVVTFYFGKMSGCLNVKLVEFKCA